MAELKPCPFCGGKAEMEDVGRLYFVRCRRCGVNQDHLYHSKQAAVKAWNRRAYICPVCGVKITEGGE